MHSAEIVFLLLCVVAALVVAARKLSLPYPVLLVLGGLALGFAPQLPDVHLQPDLIFYFFLPPLIYPAALLTSWRDFRRNSPLIVLLATGLVLATTCGVAWIAHHFVPELPWLSAFALGALVSPTDTVAATTVVRRLGVPHRIEAILEGESLVNDATGLVTLQLAVAAVMTGRFSFAHAAVEFLLVSAGGIVIGLAIALLNRAIQRRLDEAPVQITISLLTPFAAYLAAEQLHVSGVLATVSAGMFVGWHSPVTLTARVRLQATAFWEMIAFLLNGIIFILIGLQLPRLLDALHGTPITQLVGYGLAVSGAVVGVRIVWVLCATSAARLIVPNARGFAPPFRQTLLIAWAGMRGVISLAAAFALPFALPNGAPFPGRDYILFLTFAVIFVTLVLQGLTLRFVIRRLRITGQGTRRDEERRARIEANNAALEFIDCMVEEQRVSASTATRLRTEYEERLKQLSASAKPAGAGDAHEAISFRQLQRKALRVERNTIIRLRNELVINDDALRRIQHDLDLAEAQLAGE